MSKYNNLTEKIKRDFELIKQEQLAVNGDWAYYKIAVCYEFMFYLCDNDADTIGYEVLDTLDKFERPLSMWFDEGWSKTEDTLHEDFERATDALMYKYKENK